MVSFATCDDELSVTEEISARISSYMKDKQIAAYEVRTFSTGSALLDDGAFGVIFLDIRMEHPDGMETARILRQKGYHSLLVFVTALKEYVFDAFQVEAYDYLLKPMSDERFTRTMDRIIAAMKNRGAESVIIQRGTGCEVVRFSDIVYCEVLGRKIHIHKKDGTVSRLRERELTQALLRHMKERGF